LKQTSLIKNISFYLNLVVILFLFSCAQKVAPTGGPKDVTPPKVEKTEPENKSVLFKEKRITIRFDEFITLNNPSEQIVISPPLEQKPEYEISGKSLNILLRSPLAPNTTYTINFGNAIGDLHENNILPYQHYVFSTGPYLDTLAINGICLNSFNNIPEADMMVALYHADQYKDSTPFKTKPVYFGKTKPNGSFSIENIPNQNFHLLAFKDENKNLKYDKNEEMAFYQKMVNATDTLNKIFRLFTFKPDPYTPGKLLDTFCREKGKYTFISYKPLAEPVHKNANVKFFVWKDKGKEAIDTIIVFPLSKDSVITFSYQEKDSLKTFSLSTRKGAKQPAFNISVDRKLDLNDSIRIGFSTPLLRFDTSRMILKEDTNTLAYKYRTDPEGRYLLIAYPWKERKLYNLDLKDSAFYDIYNQPGKKEKTSWTTKSLKNYSSLQLFIKNNTDKKFILQLVDEKETNIIKTLSFKGNLDILMDYMPAGSYKIKFIADENGNGLWDTGNYFDQIQPEKVYYFPEKVTLREYWDLEQSIDIKDLIK
jgi:hypothetical protein